ncbi:MAG: hypothetical protein KF825_09575 [Ferruginibacter sp.]|nr:hypothetical protein [Ferruginibacter sp.]
MKQKSLLLLLPLTVLMFSACKKSDDNNPGGSFSNIPNAKVAFNNSNYGVYKGVFTGSSGNIEINVNNDNTLNAVLEIDGVTSTYTSAQTVAQNQASTITFTSGANSFVFSTTATGGNPTITGINIAGHPNSGISLLKEKSDSLVKCYEGTFRSDHSSGTFNMVINAGVMNGDYKENGDPFPPPKMIGTLTNNQLSAFSEDPVIHLPDCTYKGTMITGTISSNGQTISGTYSNCYGSGTWTGERTK